MLTDVFVGENHDPGPNMIIFSYIHISCYMSIGFPCGSDGKESACNAGNLGSISGLGRSPGGGNGNPLQYSCLKNPWTEKPGGLQSMGSHRVGHD